MKTRNYFLLLFLLFSIPLCVRFVRIVIDEKGPFHFQVDHFRAIEQTNEDRGFLMMTTSIHTHTLHTLVLSPKRGFLVGVGTTTSIPCPVPTYWNKAFEVRKGSNSYTSSIVEQKELQGGPLIISYFSIGEHAWDELLLASADVLLVVDHVLNTTHNLPVLIDPILQNNRGNPHTLSATTTFRKQYRIYQGMSKHANGTKMSDSWSDKETLKRLNHWIGFHRKAGVKHFYIIDNEVDDSKLNLEIGGNDITYIRASHMFYDTWRCYSDEYIKPKQSHVEAGQLVLENSIIRFAHTKWLLIGDVDEFFIAGDQFDHDLNKVIEYYQTISCKGEKPVECEALNQTDYRQVFALNFLPQTMTPGNERIAEVLWRFKPIVRPNLTASVSVHYSFPVNASQSTTTTIPPRQGWLAHFNKRGEKNFTANSHNWTSLLANIHNHSKFLRYK
mmetsp:Transcript_22343/g.33010  ORF Transcript_22343/g.33010 Transcript_22343/m.33010 type:complete len:444 (-) Transcript_22343:32-1363(-)